MAHPSARPIGVGDQWPLAKLILWGSSLALDIQGIKGRSC